VAAVVLLLLLCAGPSLAYVVGYVNGNEIKWRPTPNPLNFHIWTGRPVDVPGSVQAAMQAWTAEKRSNFTFNNSTETSTNTSQNDGANVVSFNNEGNSYLARTTTWYNPSSGDILENDINVNTYWSWCWSGNPGGSQFDGQSVMTHEFGHCLNLKDLYDLNSPANIHKTMYGYKNPGDSTSRTLEQDDKDGIAHLYAINPHDEVWIKDGDAALDDGSVPYAGSPFWLSPDIQLSREAPHVGQATDIGLTLRNCSPYNRQGRVIVEIHDPDVHLRPRVGVLWADTLPDILLVPGNRDDDENGTEDYANLTGDGETSYTVNWTPAANRFQAAQYCVLATVETGTDVVTNPIVSRENDAAMRNFCITSTALAGRAETLYVRAGNPTGVKVSRRLTVAFVGSDSSWTEASIPPDSVLTLNPADTFVPLKIALTPPSGAPPGTGKTVTVKSALLNYDTGETLQKGGLNWRAVVATPGDAGVKNLLAPAGTIVQGTVVTPACSVRNYGSNTLNYFVRMKIGNMYNNWVSVGAHAPSTTRYVTFPIWTASSAGTFAVTCSSEAPADTNPANDRALGSVTVQAWVPPGWSAKADLPLGPKIKKVKDGGCLTTDGVSIWSFKGNNTPEFYKYAPTTNAWAALTTIPLVGQSGRSKAVKKGGAICHDLNTSIFALKGNNTVEFWQYDVIGGSWAQTTSVPLGARAVKEGAGLVRVKVNGSLYIYMLKGSKTWEFYRYNPANGEWQALAPAPGGTSGKEFKDGSCITHDGVNTIYALKGSYNEFYAFDCIGNTWSTLTPLPLVGRSGKRKKAKSGASLVYYNGKVHCLKGGNTSEYWVYNVATGAWEQGEDVPVGSSAKLVKGGGALTGVTGALYALKGNNTLEFYSCGLTVDGGDAPGGGAATQSAVNSQQSAVSGFSPLTSRFSLRIAPNPFQGSAVVSYQLQKSGPVTLRLFDATGRLVRAERLGVQTTGNHSVSLPRDGLAAGLFILRLDTPDGTFALPILPPR
jgi:hypothetical protein